MKFQRSIEYIQIFTVVLSCCHYVVLKYHTMWYRCQVKKSNPVFFEDWFDSGSAGCSKGFAFVANG